MAPNVKQTHAHYILLSIAVCSLFLLSVSGCMGNSQKWRLLNRGDFTNGLMSPDKEKMLYRRIINIDKPTEKHQLWYQNLINKKKRLLFSTKDLIESYAWNPRNNHVSLMTYGSRGARVFNIDITKGTAKHVKQLDFLKGSINDRLFWSNNGKELGVISTYPARSRYVLVIYDFATNKKRIIKTEDIRGWGLQWGDDIKGSIWSKSDKQLALAIKDTVNSARFKRGITSDPYASTTVYITDVKGHSLKKVFENRKYNSGYYPIDWSPDNEWILVKYSFPDYLGLEDQSVKNQFFYNLKDNKLYKLILPKRFSNGKFIGWNQKDTNALYLIDKKGLWLLDFKRISKKPVDQKTIENIGPFR